MNTAGVIGSGSAAVSFPTEELILVDSEDRELGRASKRKVHAGGGLLHRAFSVFLFDERSRLLLHRRSASKPLWPGYWTNSCCSHPRYGEVLRDSVLRRVREELGCTVGPVTHVCAFEYHARYRDIGSEHELCHIFLARPEAGASVVAHPLEISELAWVDVDDVDAMMREERSDLTPWFRQEWQLLRGQQRRHFERFIAPSADQHLADPSVA